MKKRLKDLTFWLYLLGFLYWSYACYDHFQHVGEHARNLMEWVGVAGEEAGDIAKSAIK